MKFECDTLLKHIQEVNNQIQKATNSKKLVFTIYDSEKYISYATPRTKALFNGIKFLSKNPLNENDYFKYVNAYINSGKKLNNKYFRHDLGKLNEYYNKVDENLLKGVKYNPFNISSYNCYVLFMCLKLTGNYLEQDNEIFNVKIKDNREYNPLTKIPSVLRGNIPFEVKEYDIKRAFPSFIDIELNTDFRHSIYESINKSEFAIYLNSNKNSKVSITDARKGLSKIYKELSNKIITDERYNEQGKAFKDFAKYEKEYIDKFIHENKLTNCVRLHDGIFINKAITCNHTTFDKVEFSIKECIKPKIINNTISFYQIDESDKVITTPSSYADFLIQENFIRISTPDDKIQLVKNNNNIVDYYNHKTDMVTFLESQINDEKTDSIRNTIARDNLNVLNCSYTLIPSSELIYYKDNKTRFGLPFKNGFYYFDSLEKLELKNKPYQEIKGFFAPHFVQTKTFNYTDEVGNFEIFMQRISTGHKHYDSNDLEQQTIVNSFNSMFGYLCHNYKSQGETPTVILTDEGANDENRNGRRGKTLITKALEKVQKTMIKASNEFRPDYIHNYYDLDKSYNVYVIDDIEASFQLDSLYTQTTGGINVQPKGGKGFMIDFEDSPKFVVTSNWLIRYDEKNASTNARFIEYKFKPYYNIGFTPKTEFNETFFEDWNENEWNKFYSYVFRCVSSYLNNGLQKIKYDKTEDNFKASFGNDVRLSEMERIIDILLNHKKQTSFNVSEFLEIYYAYENPLQKEKLFSNKNATKLIDTFLSQEHFKHIKYKQMDRRWFVK